MVPPSTPCRRSVLTGVGAGLAAALAGCSESETHRSSPDTGTLITDYTVAITRSSGERPPIVAPREDAGEGNADGASPTPEPLSIHVVESESGAETLEFAEDARNAAAVRRLVAETAYASESVLLYQTPIGECYGLRLNYVAKDGDDGDPNVQFCRVIRDADVACERQARDHVAAAVRLPIPGDEYGSFSVGSGGGCDPVPERYRNGSESA